MKINKPVVPAILKVAMLKRNILMYALRVIKVTITVE